MSFGFIANSAESKRKAYSTDDNRFVMNGYLWQVLKVLPDSEYLMDRTGVKRLATTDPNTLCIYLSNKLTGSLLKTVLVHELGHVVMFSYDLIPRIHSFVSPSKWIEAEEWVCNFVADYGDDIFNLANHILSSVNSPRYSA